MHTHPVTSTSRHLTASMIVLDMDAAAVLLVHHKATGAWVFPGGHVDPDETPAEAAQREVAEETGVHATPTAHPHDIPGMTWHPSPWHTAEIAAPAKPERPGKPAEPAHRHIDMLFIGTADSRQPITTAPDEVHGARWVPIHHIDQLNTRTEVPDLTRAAWQKLHTDNHPTAGAPPAAPSTLEPALVHCPRCAQTMQVSDEDPDATLSEMYQHIEDRHTSYDREAARHLLTQVKLTGGAPW